MPFPVLDACFALYAGEKMGPREVRVVLAAMFPERTRRAARGAGRAKFARLFTASIYKWVQAPLSLHVGNLDLERERALQLPVVQRSEWDVPPNPMEKRLRPRHDEAVMAVPDLSSRFAFRVAPTMLGLLSFLVNSLGTPGC